MRIDGNAGHIGKKIADPAGISDFVSKDYVVCVIT